MYSHHNHFESLYDTSNNLKSMLLEYINAGFTKVAVTDHGEATTYEDLRDILNKMRDEEKKKQKEDSTYEPDERIMNFELVFGVEGYLNDGINPDGNSHIVLVEANQSGHEALCRIISESNQNMRVTPFSKQPIITMESLKKNITPGDVYCTTACIGGPFGHLFGLEEMNIREKLANRDSESENKSKTQENLEESLSKILERNEHEEEIADDLLEQFISIFGKNNFFFEVQNHFLDKEKILYNKIIRYALEKHPQFVAANDVHVGITKSNPDFDIKILARNVSKSRRFGTYQPDGVDDREYYIKTDDELKDALLQLNDNMPYTRNGKEIPFENIVDNAMKNTRFLERCVTERPKKTYYPKFNKDWTKEQTLEYFLKQIEEGKSRIFPNGFPTKEYEERLNHEIEVISSMGYIDYHLIVQEYNQYGKSLGEYVVGPGRGSAAGSLACYLLGITELDPIKYGLLFERFLNVERVSMPDIDMDFANDIREKVIDHASERYGEENTCRIVTKSYSKIKGSLREAARYLGRIDCYNEGTTTKSTRGKELTKRYYEIADNLCKQLATTVGQKDEELFDTLDNNYADPEDLDEDGMTQADILDNDESLDLLTNNSNADALKIINIAKGMNGLFMGYSMHACGGIISSEPLKNIIPLRMSDTGAMETSCSFPQAEAQGLLKMDFLGLMTLDIINDCIKKTGDKTLSNIITSNEAIEDKKMLHHIFANGLTSGVFQFASSGMINMLRDFRPDCFEDLILLVAAYRPGPMQYLKDIIEVKKYRDGRSKTAPTPAINIDNEVLQKIISPTYGAIIYQEQVMQAFQDLAGYTLGQADLVRRAMGKKHEEELVVEKKAFIYGDESRGIEGCIKKVNMSEKDADELFEQMKEFAKYAFNKSHAAAYAKLSAFTAYLLDRHPQEYITSYLNFTDKEKNRTQLLKEAGKHGIIILPPTIDHGFTKFEMVGKNQIRFGSGYIKGMSYDDVHYPDNVEDLYLMGLSDSKVKSIVNLGLVKELWNDKAHQIYNGQLDSHFKEIFASAAPLFVKLNQKKNKIEEYQTALDTDDSLTEKQIKQKTTNLNKNKREYEEILLEIEKLRGTAYEHSPMPYSAEDIIASRTAEYESMGSAFTGIEKSLAELQDTPDIDPKLYDLANARLVNVCATVVSVSDIKYTKKGREYRTVALMLKDGNVIERRFETYPTAVTGQFQIYSENGKWYNVSGVMRPLPAPKPKEKITSLFNVNNGIILHFDKCRESNLQATKILENKGLLKDDVVEVNENVTLITVSPDETYNSVYWITQTATKYYDSPVVLPYSPQLYRLAEEYDLSHYDNLFFVDTKTGRFFDMNMNERQDILIEKNIDARQR